MGEYKSLTDYDYWRDNLFCYQTIDYRIIYLEKLLDLGIPLSDYGLSELGKNYLILMISILNRPF